MRIFPAREGIPMHSSIWKLLTAVGIIGIGTFVVLEVEKRITESRKWSQPAETQSAELASAGDETDITPDAEGQFDRMVRSELLESPEDFDKPGTGAGMPAPPAGDEKFVGLVDQKVNKEDLTDGGNPFSMDEPELEEPAESSTPQPVAEPLGGTASSAAFASDNRTNAESAVQPVSFEPENEASPATPPTASLALNSAKTTPGASTSSASNATGVEKSSSGNTANNNAATKTGAKSGTANSKYRFLGSNQPQDAVQKTSDQTATEPKTAEAKSETKSAPAPRGESPQIPVKEAAAAMPAVAKAPADEPLLSFPAPVPDVTQPAAGTPGEAFEQTPFDEDTPKRIDRNPPSESPSGTTTPDLDTPEFPPFDSDPNPTPEQPTTNPRTSPGATDPRLDTPGLDTPGAEEPFTTDSDEQPVPRPDSDRTIPRRDRPETDPFPEPTYRDRTSPPFDGSDPLDSPTDRTDRDRTDRNRTGRDSSDFDSGTTSPPARRDSGTRTDEPFEMDDTNGNGRPLDDPPFGHGSEVRPLPSADDIPLPGNRPRPRPDGGRTDSRTTEVSRTEVLRPQLTIQKMAPNTASVGVPHKYTIVVANEGQESASDVLVEDQLGSEAILVDSRPVAEYDRQEGKLSWRIPRLDANEKREIVVTIKPTGEGTLDGVATVGFKTQVKSETVITAPRVELEVTGPEDAKVGSEVQLQFVIRNRGTSDASNVILRSVLPPALQHSEGADLEYEIDTLRAGDQEIVDLTVVAAEPGDRVLVSAEITANGVSMSKARTEIEVVGAQLTLERRGPERRFVGRSALYQNVVTNESKFEAVNSTVVEEIPEGSRFVSASNAGSYDAQKRLLTWAIPRLPAGKQLALEVELVTDEAGEVESVVEVVEDAGFRTPLTQNTKVTVEDLHNVTADISRQDEPVAVGEQFGFTVTIENRGTALARNVQMSVQVPQEIRVLAAGTKQLRGDLFAGNLVKYQTVPEIQPNQKVTFQIKLQGQQKVRNAPVKASLIYDEMPEPLVVSESVTVFDDRP
jgi:uncharacterized repeat protein (TIGR01451 family)